MGLQKLSFFAYFQAFMLILGLSFGPAQAKPPSDSFRFEDLKFLIDSKGLTSIDSVIGELPIELRQNFTLMHNPQGGQAGTYEAPRAILFGKDAKLVLTFNGGDPGKIGSNSLEIMEFNEATSAFEFRHIDFLEGQLPKYSQVNPGKCMGCHMVKIGSTAPRPNWDPYRIWHGAYGSDDDHYPATVDKRNHSLALEKSKLMEFILARPKLDRYRHLVVRDNSPIGNYSTTEFDLDYSKRPNLMLTLHLMKLNFDRVWAQLNRQPRFGLYRDIALLGMLADFSKPSHFEFLNSPAIDQLYSVKYKQQLFRNKELVYSTFQAMGLKPADISLKFSQNLDWNHTGIYYNGEEVTQDVLIERLWRDAYDSDRDMNIHPFQSYERASKELKDKMRTRLTSRVRSALKSLENSKECSIYIKAR